MQKVLENVNVAPSFKNLIVMPAHTVTLVIQIVDPASVTSTERNIINVKLIMDGVLVRLILLVIDVIAALKAFITSRTVLVSKNKSFPIFFLVIFAFLMAQNSKSETNMCKYFGKMNTSKQQRCSFVGWHTGL